MILILSQFGYESLFYLRLALLESIFCSYAGFVGGVAEWLNAPVLKTDVGESLPWVRIPPPPPLSPLRTSDSALTGTDFSVLSKGFA